MFQVIGKKVLRIRQCLNEMIYVRKTEKRMLRAFAPNILFLNRSFCNIYFADLPECGVHIRHIFFHRHRLVMKNTIIAGRTEKNILRDTAVRNRDSGCKTSGKPAIRFRPHPEILPTKGSWKEISSVPADFESVQ